MRQPLRKYNSARLIKSLDNKTEKRLTFSKVANSSFFLWLLSAIFISGIGSFFSAKQTCIKDADALEDRRFRIYTEIQFRLDWLYNSVSNAKTLNDLKQSFALWVSFQSEFKDASFYEVERQYIYVLRKTYISEDSSKKVFTYSVYLAQQHDGRYNSGLERLKQRVLSGEGLSFDDVKQETSDGIDHYKQLYDSMSLFSVHRNCGLVAILRATTGDDPSGRPATFSEAK